MPVRLICFVLFQVFVSCNIYAQVQLSGAIVESGSKPIPYLTLQLSKAGSTKKLYSITDTTGKFRFVNVVKGEYQLLISGIGIQERRMQVLVDTVNKELDLIVFDNYNSKSLQEVSVSFKKQVQQKIDRMVFNVAGTPVGQSGSILELLERVPGIEINSQLSDLALNGKNNVGIMINDKITRLPISAILNLLSGTSANAIERIEIITNPPAKYDAEFSGGLIHIVYKKKETEKLSGSFLIGLGYGKKDKEKFSLNWSGRVKKAFYFGDVNFDRNDNPRTYYYDYYRDLNDTIATNRTISYRKPVVTNYIGRLGGDYYLNKKWTVGVLANFSSNRYNETVNGDNSFQVSANNNQLQAESLKLSNTQKAYRNLFSLNVNNFVKLDSLTSLNIDLDYVNFYSTAPNYYKNVRTSPAAADSAYYFTVSKITPVAVWGGKIDYEKLISSKIKIGFGTKYTASLLKNEVAVNDLVNAQYVKNNELSDNSSMHENILAFYYTMDWNLDRKTKLNAGVRYENYQHRLNLKDSASQLYTNNNIFPALFISRSLTRNQNIQFSYGRRINRPDFFALAPYILFIDPNTYSYGNIYLKPSISNVISGSYKFKSYIGTIEYTSEKNAIASAQSVFQIENNRQVLTSVNLDRLNYLSLSILTPFTLTNWWSIQNNLQGFYYLQTWEGVKKRSTTFTIKTTQDFKIDKSLTAQLFFSFNSRKYLGTSTTRDLQRVSINISKNLKKINGNLLVSFNDIFGRDFQYDNGAGNVYSHIKYVTEARVVRVTFVKNFGASNNSKERKRETSTSEQKKRLE